VKAFNMLTVIGQKKIANVLVIKKRKMKMPKTEYKHATQIAEELHKYKAETPKELQQLHDIGPWCGWCTQHLSLWFLMKMSRELRELRAVVDRLNEKVL